MTHIEKSHAIENVSRRGLLKGIAAGGGLVLMARLLPTPAQAADMHEVYDTGATGMPHGTVSDPHVFVSIEPSGVVTIVAHRGEMGTGVRTSLPMIVAEELDADWSRVRIAQAPGDEPRYGNQDTDGSRSLRHFLQPMRECGAACRLMLEMAAAARWDVALSDVHAVNHEVINRVNSKRLGYGEIAADAAALPTPALDKLTFKEPTAYRYIGKGNIGIVDLFDITTGRAGYGADHRLPGQKYAVIARPPVVGGKLVSFDATAALAVPGVEMVIPAKGWQPPGTKFLPVGGVAVIARNTGAAIKGRAALKIVWDDGPNKNHDSEAYRAELEAAARAPGQMVRNDGDADGALKTAAEVISAEYFVPYLAHATMEPPVALANVTGGKCEVWAPVQSSWGTREDLAKLLEIPVDDVTVHVTLLGGGFGRKSKCDFVLEGALLSKEIGAPVQIQWTREDDIRNGYYHAISAQRIEAGLDANKKVVAWRHRSAAPTILSTFAAGSDHLAAFEASMGMVDLPFAIPNIRAETGAAGAHTRIGWLRSVYNIQHAFAIQSFVAELAHATGRDPKDFLLDLLGPARIVDPRLTAAKDMFWDYGEPWDSYPIDAGRLRRVVEIAADKAGWGQKLPAGQGMGIAVHRAFVTYVATVVRVAVDAKGSVTIPQVDTAIDCGFHVNPERINSQIEGAAVFGLSIAKSSAINFRDGRVVESNFDDYLLARIDDAPLQTNVHILPATYDIHASGVGEPGVPPFAPALCNAIFAATGKRIRSLPIGDQLEPAHSRPPFPAGGAKKT
jgi:isoquinoline 1-oxidoreductase beta subunit